MNISKAFGYVFEDINWVVKIAIYAGLSFFSFFLLPIPILLGYNIAITRNVKDGMKDPLPEWNDFGKMFMDGLNVWVAQLVYTLPFLLIVCIATVATFGLGGLGGAIGSEEAMAASALGIWGVWGLMGCLTLLLIAAAIFIMPALIIQYVRYDSLGACFRFGEVLGIARDNIGDIFITLAAAMGAIFVLVFILFALSLIPCIGTVIGWFISILVGPYVGMAVSHMYGQIASKSQKLAGYV